MRDRVRARVFSWTFFVHNIFAIHFLKLNDFIERYAVASMAVAPQEVILQWKHFAFVKYVGMD